MNDMNIAQAEGSRNYSLHWRDGHVVGGHPTVWGWMIGNHSTMPLPDTRKMAMLFSICCAASLANPNRIAIAAHFNWGIDFPGTVSTSPYSGWATKGAGAPDCTWITFCTSCCPPPGTGPDCCCVSNGTAATDGASDLALKAAHPPDTPQPRVVHWCKHPYCPYKLPPGGKH